MDKSDFIKWAEKLQHGYKINDAVRKDLSQVELLAIVGPTGVGKTAVIDALGIQEVKSDVSRKMRRDEKYEKNYHFRDDYLEIMREIKSGEYVQFLISNSGEFYGTHSSSYPDSGICVMAIFANAIDTFRKLGFKRVLPIYIMPPGYVEWMRRVGTNRHGDIHERIAEAIESIKIAIQDKDYHFVLNDNIDLAVNDINNIINGQKPDEHRSILARETADILLERLGDQDDDFFN
jgi:guanylate kinase